MITRVILNLNIKKLTLKNFGKIKKFESIISCEQLDQQLFGSSKVFSSSLKFTFYFFKNFENFYRFFRKKIWDFLVLKIRKQSSQIEQSN